MTAYGSSKLWSLNAQPGFKFVQTKVLVLSSECIFLLAKHPQNWTKDEVGAWLRWCSEEFCIDSVPPEKFDMNGRSK